MTEATQTEAPQQKKVQLTYGALPSRSFLHIALVRRGESGSHADGLLFLMRSSLRRLGPNPLLEQTLNALGFVWGPKQADLSMVEDVDAVDAALGSEDES
jgi:hypothetical protein